MYILYLLKVFYFNVSGFFFLQVYHLLAEKQLPGPINAKRACKECSHLTSCSMYQKLENNIPPEPHAMSELVPTVLDHLTSEDVEFFNKVCNFTKYLKTQTNSLLLFHSNLDIVNKSVRPFLFTILNNSYISNVICLVILQNGSWVFFTI